MNLVVLRSTDVDRAAKFYAELGLSLTKHRHGNGPEHYSSEWNGFVFEIYPGASSTSATRIGFVIDDVDSIFGLLVKVGAIPVAQPGDSEWGRRAVLRDFDGHTVELLTRT